MRKFYTISLGEKYGRLTVIENLGKDERGNLKWLCRCDCGGEVSVINRKLGSGHTQSCGCYQRERAAISSTRHGLADSRLYSIWSNMKNRCNEPKNKAFHRYGGRGISYHSSFETFEGFLAGIPDGYHGSRELDRIDNDGDYTPGNLRWLGRRGQVHGSTNTQKFNHPVTGELTPLPLLAEEFNIPQDHLSKRIREGLSLDEALAKPVVMHKPRYEEKFIREVKQALWSLEIKDVSAIYGVSVNLLYDIRNGDKYSEVSEFDL